MIRIHHTAFAASALSVLAMASASQAATFTPIGSYDPDTYFSGGFTAAIDFDDGGPTLAGATGIPASNNTSYNVSNGGITFDIVVTGTTTGNQNRDRGAGTVSAPHGDLTRDFEQWYNNQGGQTEAEITLSGLVADTDYDIDLFMYNIGAGQTTQAIYDGPSSASPLITTFSTSGNDNNSATWNPGPKLTFNSGSNSEIVFAVQSQSNGRLTINGLVVYQGATIPEPGSLALLGLGGLLIARRRRG